MSQVSIINIENNNPQIPTQFVGNVGVAIPIGNVLEILGDVDQGLTTIASGNTVEITFTNRLQGIATSINGSTEDLITFTLQATPGSYRFDFQITGRDTTTNDALGYTMFCSARTDGITATVVATPFTDTDEDSSLISASLAFVASGNDVIVQVTGVVGQTINYKCLGNYVVV
jgi:hypothetical protein